MKKKEKSAVGETEPPAERDPGREAVARGLIFSSAAALRRRRRLPPMGLDSFFFALFRALAPEAFFGRLDAAATPRWPVYSKLLFTTIDLNSKLRGYACARSLWFFSFARPIDPSSGSA